MARTTNEWEFQGALLSWLNNEISTHSYTFGSATQEFPNKQGKRSDVVVWADRASGDAVLEVELKTPETPVADGTFRADAVRKAQTVNAPYVALWNIRTLELYHTPSAPRKTLDNSDFLGSISSIEGISSVQDWLVPGYQDELRRAARKLLLSVNDLASHGSLGGTIVDATIFVDGLRDLVGSLRLTLEPDVQIAMAGRRETARAIREWAESQGLRELVSDLNQAISGQIAYRIAGQVLFYYAFRRQQSSLPPISLTTGPVMPQLRAYWDRVRTFDYEALFGESILDNVSFSPATEAAVRKITVELTRYSWDDIRSDVLGSIFEQLLPESERITLGQYYTPPHLADVIVSMVSKSEDDIYIDPACGSGTFLMRTYDRLRRHNMRSHHDCLNHLWGVDISAFAAELAVINLCRQDLSTYSNYPRLIVRDFFTLKPGEEVRVPLPRFMPGSAGYETTPLPVFDVVLGNPPFVRSQQLDDLNESYKGRLQHVSRMAGVDDAKFDAFAYFIFHSSRFLRVGGRLAFVTSAAWLTSHYGSAVQRFLLEKMRIQVVLFSEVEPFFPMQEVNTVVVVAEKVEDSFRYGPDEAATFITLTQPLSELLPREGERFYWSQLDSIVDDWLGAPAGPHEGFRIARRNARNELEGLKNNPESPRRWVVPLRESQIYVDIFGEEA